MFLFAYGTLNKTLIQKKLIGRILMGSEDFLDNYKIIEIKDSDQKIYPAITESKNNFVKGMIYEVLKLDLLIFDEYEGDEYKRIGVTLRSGKNAQVYIKK